MKTFSKTFLKLIHNTALISKTSRKIPEEGMGATSGAGADCYPHTVVEVAQDLSYIKVTPDYHKPAKGFEYYGNQVYNYSREWNAPATKYTLRKNGYYITDGAPMKATYLGIWLGTRRYYQDPSF